MIWKMLVSVCRLRHNSIYKEDLGKAYWCMSVRSNNVDIYIVSLERLVYACIGIQALTFILDMACCYMQIHQ